MQVLALLSKDSRLPALAEACLVFSPQVALGEEAVFVEILASRNLFSLEECLKKAGEILKAFDLEASIAIADSPSLALAFARYGKTARNSLPVESLADFLSPFHIREFAASQIFRKLGIETVGDFLQVPRSELASRFGKDGLLANEKILRAHEIAWPRFRPAEVLCERADFECAAQITNLGPLLFLLSTALHRIFLRLQARREKLVDLDVTLHLNRFFGANERLVEMRLPLPHSDPKALLSLLHDRLQKELEKRPLEDALEGVSLVVRDTAPFLDTQRELFSKAEEEKEAWSSLVARLQERLGKDSSFLAVPAPRLLPEASWKKSLEKDSGTVVPTPTRPLRMLKKPLPLRRQGERLSGGGRSWMILAFQGPERLSGEWWLEEFRREYYRVETNTELLWVFRNAEGLFLHGIFD